MSSDDENVVIPSAHKKLLSEINEIVKFQHIRKPARSEPALKNSEFHLVKTKTSGNDNEPNEKSTRKNVSISSVAQTVQKNTKQKQIGNQLKNAFKNENVLAKPLEKIFADRIKRTIAYDNTRNKLARWDAVVTKNQNAEQLQFPIVLEKTRIRKNDPDAPTFRYKTQMMKELEEIKNECFPKKLQESTTTETAPELLTLEEMKERRKELGRLKLKESQKIAKKRQQGKIKSKKYHKLKKREELKRKMKEFEELKVTNPEAALKELEKIERQRVQERTTLRHKNTGTWAKNLQVRAKYDANVKQDLEAQLALSRELTQKNQQSESSDSEDEEAIAVVNGENPWLGTKEAGDPLDEVFSGYKKFWEQHNATQKQLKRVKRSSEKPVSEEIEKPATSEESEIEEAEEEDLAEEENSDEGPSDSEDENPSKFINDFFDEAEEKMSSKMDTKLSELKPMLLEKEKKKKKFNKKRGANVRDANYLGFEKRARLGDIDVALNEGEDDEVETAHIASKYLLKEIKQKKEEKKTFMKGSEDINPEFFLSVKSKHLITALPKSQEFDDIDDEVDVNKLSKANKLSLAEAFENDDIVNDFEQEVENEHKKQFGIEEAALPGWGSWGGQGVKSRPKFMKKVPDVKKKDRIIISSAVNEKLQKHLISSVPFPFKSVQDFEASMRLPIGRDFIPETAHRKLTLPPVVTKAGTIIEPMSEDILVQGGPTKNRFMKRGKKGKKVRK